MTLSDYLTHKRINMVVQQENQEKNNKDHKIEQGNRDRAKRAKYSDCVKSGLPKTYSANNPPYKGTSAWKRVCCGCRNNIRTTDET